MRYGTENALAWCAKLHPAVGPVSSQAVIGAGAAAHAGAVGGVALVAAACALTPTLCSGRNNRQREQEVIQCE